MKNHRNSIIIYDCNALCHTARHSAISTDYEGDDTSILYGFLGIILNIQRYTKCNKFAFCWDSKKSIRSEIYPQYKQNRKKIKKSKEEQEADKIAFNQFTILEKEILPAIGFKNVFKVKGLEGDDLIANICKKYSNNKKVIVSKDNDLFQLLDYNTVCYDHIKRSYFGRTNFAEKYNIFPDKWGEVKSISGCTGDGVQGIRGVGNATAIKYINGVLKETTIAYKKIVSRQGRRTIKITRDIVVLPSPNPKIRVYPYRKELVVKKDKLKWKDFYSVCLQYGFDSFIKNKRDWKKLFIMR